MVEPCVRRRLNAHRSPYTAIWVFLVVSPLYGCVTFPDTVCERWNTKIFFKAADKADVARCLKAGADVHTRSTWLKFTPLHMALIFSKNPSVVRVLLDAGADVNVRDLIGGTPLHVAASDGKNSSVVRVLLDAGADVNARDLVGSTPLHVAVVHNRPPAIVNVLLDAGADVNARNKKGLTPWDRIKPDSALVGTDAYRRLNEARFR